jgi:hypothetical protein
MESNNLWLYANNYEQCKVADSLLLFGAEQFKSSKIIREVDILNAVLKEFGTGFIPVQIQKDIIIPFALSYLIDSIKIIIFFENYMKSELLRNDFLIHKVCSKEEYKAVKKQQEKRPLKLIELDKIKGFSVNEKKQYIGHEGVTAMTLGFKDLIRKDTYCKQYKFDDNIRNIALRINDNRNRLHLYESIDFTLSSSFMEDLKQLIDFVEGIIHPVKQFN